MPYTQKAKLILAVGLVTVTIVLLVASRRPVKSAPLREKLQDKGKRDLITREFKNMPLKFNAIRNKDSDRKMRRKDRSKLPASASELAELPRKAASQEKRSVKVREFKDMPLKVQAIRNLDKETWHKDLQIEVKNIGTKPIYSVLAYLEFLDQKPPDDSVTAIILRFGERKYIDIRVVGDPQDSHINPGDTYVFTIEDKYRKGLAIKHEKSPELFTHMELRFNLISFGDGTGFEVGDPTDYRQIKKSSSEDKKHQVWAHFKSTDGGQSWTYDDRETYAGCYYRD
jgi:hypothetical protein